MARGSDVFRVVLDEALDCRRQASCLLPWWELTVDGVVAVFGEGPFVELARRSLAEAAYLGFCYDPSSPYVLSYPDVRERKDVVLAACRIAAGRHRDLMLLSEGDVVQALVHLLMKVRPREWALLVAYEELLWKTLAGALYTDEAEIAMLRSKGKTVADWLVSRKRALDAAQSILEDSVRPLSVDMALGDSVASDAIATSMDYTPEAISDVFSGVGLDEGEAYDEDDYDEGYDDDDGYR